MLWVFFVCFSQSNPTDCQSGSLWALDTSADLVEDTLDGSSASPQRDEPSPQGNRNYFSSPVTISGSTLQSDSMVTLSCFLAANGEEDVEVEEGEDGEDLDQVLPNGEASDVGSGAEEESETLGREDGGAAENLPSPQRSIIEDIRSGLAPPVFLVLVWA